MVTGWERYLKRQNEKNHTYPRIQYQGWQIRKIADVKTCRATLQTATRSAFFLPFFLAVQCLQYNTLHQTSGGIH